MGEKMNWTKYAKYFRREEFDSADEVGSGDKMSERLIERLYVARELSMIPFIINSGYRTEKHNKKVGGVKNSSHLRGLAVDIASTKDNRYWLIKSLLDAGFTRIGIADTFIHVDIDDEKNKFNIWLY